MSKMFTFDLRGASGILIFTLYKYRLGEGREYHTGYSIQKRLNSYAFYNTETKELKVVHYDYVKARIFDSSIQAYTVSPGEHILGLKGFSCYYIDHNGQEVGYAGDISFFYNYQVADEKTNDINNQDINVITDYDECDLVEELDFVIDGNKIIYGNGEIYESKYLLKEKIKNIIICYAVVEAKKCYETRLLGICDQYGNLLSEIKYDEIWASSNQIIRNKYLRVKIKDKFGIISFDGKEVLPVIYEFVDDCDGKIAIVNHGSQLIDIKDLSVLYETNGRILKSVNGWMRVDTGHYPANSLGLLDSSGVLYEFFEKIGFWKQYEKKKYYIDLGASFNNGLLPVFSENRGYGYVDIDSNEVIECKYCEISDFENGKAKVRLDCEYGYINIEGCMLVHKDEEEIVIPNTYDWSYDYKNGYFVVQKGKLYGALDASMNEIIPCSLKSKGEVELTYEKIRLHSLFLPEDAYKERYNDLLPPIRYEENNLFGFKSVNGVMLFPPVLRIGDFVEGMAKINIMGKFGYVNEKLELVIQPLYEYACDFSEGLALVHAIGEYDKFINKSGETIITCKGNLENIKSFHNGVAKCEFNPCIPGKDNEDAEITKYQIGYRTH